MIVCMRMDSGWKFSRYHRPSCYGLFIKDNLHEVHELLGPQYDIVFFLGYSCICTNQHNKSLFSDSFIIFLMPTSWIENMVLKMCWD